MNTVLTLWTRFIESPLWRFLASSLFNLASGVLASAFVVEITTKEGALHWSHFYAAKSFYGALFCLLLFGLYQYLLFRHEKDLLQFADSTYCIAYMRSKCLPEAADRFREFIRKGEHGELTKAMDELTSILK